MASLTAWMNPSVSPRSPLNFSGSAPLTGQIEVDEDVLSDGTIHRVIQRTGVERKGLGFNLCVAPPHDRIVPDFRVMEITEVFWSRPEKMEETRGLQRWVHFVNIRTDPIIHDLFV